MKIKIIATKKKLTTLSSNNPTYITYKEAENNIVPITKQIWIPDVNGIQLKPIPTDNIPERRNGLPSHSYTYSYNGSIHIYAISNFNKHQLDIIEEVEKIFVSPYTYITTWEYIIKNNEELEEEEVITYWKNNHKSEYGNKKFPIIQGEYGYLPTFMRVCFTGINAIDYNSGCEPYNAYKEYDLDFEVHGVWNAEGLITQNVIYGTADDLPENEMIVNEYKFNDLYEEE